MSNKPEIEKALDLCIPDSSGGYAKWLRKFCSHESSYNSFNSINNELFVQSNVKDSGLLVSSATENEGCSSVAFLLALYTGIFDPLKKVLLVDADMEGHALTEVLSKDINHPGLNEFCLGQTEFDNILQHTGVTQLFFVSSALTSATFPHILPEKMNQFMGEARSRFDLVIVNSPPGGRENVARALASLIGKVLLVIRHTGATREQVKKFANDLELVNTDIVGCIFNQRHYDIPGWLYGAHR